MFVCWDLLKVQLWSLTYRNSHVNIALWLLLGYANLSLELPWPLLLPMHWVTVFLIDLVERWYGWTLWSREQSSILLYNRVRFSLGDPFGEGVDLGFNFYDGDYSKSPQQAQLDKFEHAWKLLGLKEGMRVLDCGCGMGDWMYWLKNTKGCYVVGVNMTHAHVLVVRQRGMECVHSDWQSLHANKAEFAKLAGNFDAVTFWDTIEHYCKAQELPAVMGNKREPPDYPETPEQEAIRAAVYGDMFKMARGLIDPASPCGKVWTSCLHQTHCWRKESWYGLWQIYVILSYYDGVYPYLHDGLSKHAPLSGFKLVHEEDRTEDYRMTSLISRNHFGFALYAFQASSFLCSILGLITDPHWFVFHFDTLVRAHLGYETSWMWHIGGIVPHKPAKDAISKLLWQVYA